MMLMEGSGKMSSSDPNLDAIRRKAKIKRPPERYGPIRRFFCRHMWKEMHKEYLYKGRPERWMSVNRPVYGLFEECLKCGKRRSREIW